MSAIEDTRKVIQDFLALELRAITVRMDSLEKRVDALDKKVDDKFAWLDKKIDGVDKRAEARHAEVMMALRQLFDLKSVHDRLDRLEAKRMEALELAHK